MSLIIDNNLFVYSIHVGFMFGDFRVNIIGWYENHTYSKLFKF